MKNNNYLLMFYVKNIIKKIASEIELMQIPELIVVPRSKIQNFEGIAEFSVVDGKMKFCIKIDSKLISEDNIKDNKSQLYITIYHELCHLKNLELLSNGIPLSYMIDCIDNYTDKDSMMYAFAFMLWGEYYAYKNQFMKYNQNPSEYNLLQCINKFRDDIVNGKHLLNKQHSLHDKYIKSLQQDVYNLLYEVAIILAYKSSYIDYNLEPMVNNINTFLNVDVKEYVYELEQGFCNIQKKDMQCINVEDFNKLGCAIYQIYDILKFKIEFVSKLEISFDKTQPLISFAYEFKE